ncbi:MAG: hypothetical protein NTW30_02170 [Candidatus Aenigmarchaeota archaeon]|nr:hypothetical protein [Candidatus Aenigmarchaeota archaeon]
MRQILHYPRLDTVLMVEEAIRKSKEHPTKMILWRSLPKKMMYQTLLLILNYLEESGKIVIKDKKIIWIYDSDIDKWIENRELIVR